ncbi:MAG: acetylglutamate kinase [Puniceicoccaceae bacterium]
MSTPSIDIQRKTEVLLEALPYIQQFRDSVFVVKYGGSFMDDPDPAVRSRVATDVVFLSAVGIRVVVVHGGGKSISRAIAASGATPVFRDGLRVTDQATIQVVEQTLNHEVNLEICEMIQHLGGRPLGIFGNRVLRARKLTHDQDGNPIDLGFVGEVTSVDSAPIHRALAEGYTPIISPLSSGPDGVIYNTNADIAASKLATALRARRLVYLSDVPGLLADPSDPGTLISTLLSSQVSGYQKKGVISKGMVPKINSAVEALQQGVRRVHLIDGRVPHSLLLEIFTDRGVGTEIVSD